MAITIISTNRNPDPWKQALLKRNPDLDVRIWPDDGNKEEIEFAICWNHPVGVLKEYPGLKCVSSMGAGVDHIFNDPELPKGMPVVRVVDKQLSHSMFEYLLAVLMSEIKGLERYRDEQTAKKWNPFRTKGIKDTLVGIMGLGELGSFVAENLAKSGFHVKGWSRSFKMLDKVSSFSGVNELDEFLSELDFLICLLPLTPETSGILNEALFKKLPASCVLINVARGGHLVEQDLLDALENGSLKKAVLDVFQEEPLPSPHPFWKHEKIRVTPHCSSITDPESASDQILENYRRICNCLPYKNQVDPRRGY